MRKIIIAVAVVVMTTGCEKFTDIEGPIDRITAPTAFSTDASANSAVTGIYAQMLTVLPYICNGGVTINAGLSADELTATNAGADLLEINSNSITPGNNIITVDLWSRAYAHIYHVNACMEGLNQSAALSAATKARLLGETKFLRAWLYFYLVNLYGDVPLITATDYAQSASLPRTAVNIIYDSIIADLGAASGLLPVTNSGKLRPTRDAAKALLARVYLYLQRWQAAEATATEVMGAGTSSLVSNLNNVFLANSNEAIWQLMPVSTTQNTLEGNRFIPVSTLIIPNYVVTSQLVSAFESGDQRKTAWLKFNTVSGNQYYYPYKYKVRSSTTVTEHYMMLRLAELYLVRAEARAQQDKLAEAKADINALRTRAGLANTTANDKNSVLAAIEKERRTELFAEWGHRWLDLKRTNRADAVLGAIKPGWNSAAALYPIPQQEILHNPLLSQNPGY